ncbi:MAG: hypothetical protein JXA15_05555 [Spirochaetales bacterium]|nr:hypothetical protein [Spirochaetales bacterium]
MIYELHQRTLSGELGEAVALAPCRGIASEHGGSIGFESSPGRTVFRVEPEAAREP